MKYYFECKACGTSIQNQLGNCLTCYVSQLLVIVFCFLCSLTLPLLIYLALSKYLQG